MIHNAFGLSGPALLPLFEEYMRETCSELVKPKRAWSDRQWGTTKFLGVCPETERQTDFTNN